MGFSTNLFLFIYLPVTVLLYTVMHPKLKNIFLIAASLVFFGWADMDHIPLLLIFIVVNYIAAKLIAKTKKRIF